ncbi:hypothetical protein BGZ68_004377, partial [Mortierella alpina]
MWNKQTRDEDLEMASTASTSLAPSIAASDVDLTSIASQDGTSMGAPREAWAWAVKNKWAERATKEG